MREGQHEDTIDNLERFQEEINDLHGRLLHLDASLENLLKIAQDEWGLTSDEIERGLIELGYLEKGLEEE